MIEREYIFTGFYPSGNPFDLYYDANQSAAFTTSVEVSTWSKTPKVGDKIKIVRDGPTVKRVFINGDQVFQWSLEKEQEKSERYDSVYDKLKRDKRSSRE
jgi:hypothetical protein